jgi:uncharacterized membrane protein YcaP (DUF421 family)
MAMTDTGSGMTDVVFAATTEWGELLGFPTSPVEVVVRATLIYLAVITLMRIVGRRESGALTLNDLLVVILIGEVAGGVMVQEEFSIPEVILLVATLLAWSVFFDFLAYRFPRLGRVLKSTPKPLVEDGELVQRTLRRELISDAELGSQLRLHGVTDMRKVRRAYLEPNGMLSVFTDDDSGTDPDARPPIM